MTFDQVFEPAKNHGLSGMDALQPGWRDGRRTVVWRAVTGSQLPGGSGNRHAQFPQQAAIGQQRQQVARSPRRLRLGTNLAQAKLSDLNRASLL